MDTLHRNSRSSVQVDSTVVVGCDLSGESSVKAQRILTAFTESGCEHAKLILMEKRSPDSDFCVWNYVEENGLQSRVEYLPYYRANPTPDAYRRCNVWVDKHTPESFVTGEHLRRVIDAHEADELTVLGDGRRHVLFFTAFHPYKKEGNSVYAMQMLDYLQENGFIVHLIYYEYQREAVTEEMRAAAARDFHYYYEIPITSKLVGYNQNGLNVHVDDWCGCEVIQFVESLCDRFDFESCIVNYAFHSGVFEAVPDRARKVLLTIDKIANRNQRMLAQGYPHSGWISLTEDGERIGCQRADMLVAIQAQEAEYFRTLTDGKKEVVVLSPIFPKNYVGRTSGGAKLRVGYFGSKNFVNETNLAELIGHVNANKKLRGNFDFVVAGGASEDLDDFLSTRDARVGNIRCLGQVEDLRDFFSECDVVINPERGGTGMKLKTVESMANGMAVVCTKAGAAGINSSSRFHSAETIVEVAALLGEIKETPTILDDLERLSRELYDEVYAECHGRMKNTLHYSDRELRTLTPPADISRPETPSVDHPKGGRVSSMSGRVTVIPKTGDKLLSVIIPFYNVEQFIGECIESVLSQSYSNLEIILVDDCSPDGSRAVAERYCRSDSRIRLLTHETNQGLGPARNTAVRESTGEYLFFLDSDDLLKPDALGTLLRAAEPGNAKLVIGSCDELLPDGSVTDWDRRYDNGDKNVFGMRDGVEAFRGALSHPGAKFLPVRAWGTLIDRASFVACDLEYPPVEHEDLAVTPFLYQQIGSLLYLPDLCVTYRVRESSLSRHGWDHGRLERQALLWDIISANIRRFGLDQYMGTTAATFCGHLIWKIETYGCEASDLDAIFDVVYKVVADMEASPDFEVSRLRWMIQAAKRIVCRYDGELQPARFNRMLSSFGAPAMVDYYQHLLN